MLLKVKIFIYSLNQLCPENDLLNKPKVWLFKAFRVILDWDFEFLKYIKMHMFGLIFILYFT